MILSRTRCLFIVALLASCTALAVAAPSFTVERGNFRLVVYEKLGTFSLYYAQDPPKRAKEGDAKRFEAVISETALSKTTGLSVRIDGKVKKLQRGFGIKVAAEETDEGAAITYTLKNAEVVLRFRFCSSAGGMAEEDAIAFDVDYTNTSDKKQDLSLKAILDTLLGEEGKSHFTTAAREEVTQEAAFDAEREQWVLSRGKRVSLRVLALASADRAPSTIVLANRERLTDALWMPLVGEGRNFNASYSVNDSAIALFWDAQTVEPQSTVSYSIALTGSGASGEPAIALLPAEKSEEIPPPPMMAEVDERLSMVLSSLEQMSEEDRAYIQGVLSRIREIEADPASAQLGEIAQLSEELDRILERFGG